MLEERIGYEIHYPSDCERLMYEIAQSTHQHIGVTTLKRLFGFIGGTSTPRMSTLDILAGFLGYRNYNDLIRSLDPDNELEQKPILQLNAKDIGPDKRIRLFFNGITFAWSMRKRCGSVCFKARTPRCAKAIVCRFARFASAIRYMCVGSCGTACR